MKEQYVNPEIEIIYFDTEEIITDSSPYPIDDQGED